MNRIVTTLLLASFSFPLVAFAQETPVGLWKTIDDKTGQPKSLVRITESNGVLTGKVEKLMRKPDEDQNPLCTECEGELKDKPVLGMTILNGLKKDGAEWSGGTILDPKNGKTYKSKLAVIEGGKKLSLRGYIGVPMFGRSQVWERSE